ALAPLDPAPSPCARCQARPCESTCPVGAIGPGGYDAAACAAHVASPAGVDCLELGCRARRSCPVGADYRYGPAQATLHMRAFIGRR
ncbi:MAG: hypothetical protein JSR54_17365, partial [Proteobacteria bacterium]|nr:hypothetical protein [Pseudomonadota bacterium]